MSAEFSILVIEDEPQIRRFVRSALESEGWRVYEAERGGQGLTEAATRKPDLLVVDLGLPDMDGVDLVRDFRSWSDAPILILSARSDEQDKIVSLDAGADDYLTKPFGVGELLARSRALIRRRMRGPEREAKILFGDIEVNLPRRLVLREGKPVRLTPTEYRLLTVLVAGAGKVMTQRHLMNEVWGPRHAERGHYLRIYISHLRQKLERDPAQPAHILTESGVGYRFQQ